MTGLCTLQEDRKTITREHSFAESTDDNIFFLDPNSPIITDYRADIYQAFIQDGLGVDHVAQ